MLFATYQKMETNIKNSGRVLVSPESMFKKLINEETRDLPIYKDLPYIDEFGFQAIWCFPVLDFKSFIIHSMLTEPNIPMMFYVFESNDFKRIDKIQHYKQIKNGSFDSSHLKDFVNDSLEDRYSEFIVNANTLTWNNCVCASPVSDDARAFSHCALIFPLFLAHSKEYTEFSNKLSCALMDLKKLFPAKIETFATSDEIHSICCDDHGKLKVQLNSELDKIVQIGPFLVDRRGIAKYRNIKFTFFEPFILPLLYENFILDQQKCLAFRKLKGSRDIKMSLSTFMSVLYNSKEIYQYMNNFSIWATEDCSYEGYNNIYNNIERLIIDINDEEQLKFCADSVLPKLQQVVYERERGIAKFNEHQRVSEFTYDEHEYQRNVEQALIEHDRRKKLLEIKMKEKRRTKEKQVKEQKKKLRKKNKKN